MGEHGISDDRKCPVRPDDELACLIYPTLTDLPERTISGQAYCPPQKKSPWKLWLLLLVAITAAGLMLLQMGVGENRSPDLVLKNFDPKGISEYAFGTEIRKGDITSITFQDTLKAAPADAVDVSETGSGQVLLWTEESRLYIAGNGKVFFPADSSCLFGGAGYYGYGDLKQIDFHNAVDTSHVTDMSGMFSRCSGLTSLDVSGFDTRSVTDMGTMFMYCSSLARLDLSSFDTRNVTDMGTMLMNCSSLTSLDLSSFDTGSVMYMGGMFCFCSSLTSLDLSSFNTRNVISRRRMFFGCSPALALETDDQRIWNQFLEDT